MPRRHVLKIDVTTSYYHVFTRGAGKQTIFADHDDFHFFLHLFARYLSPDISRNSAGVAYQKVGEDIELLAYCLMGNHVHLLLYQQTAGSMARLMRGVMTAYSRYYNTKYQRSGQLFESRYKASRLPDLATAAAVSRYIHRNPLDWARYPYSSLYAYSAFDTQTAQWLHPARIVDTFDSRIGYRAFLEKENAALQDQQGLRPVLADDGYAADLYLPHQATN